MQSTWRLTGLFSLSLFSAFKMWEPIPQGFDSQVYLLEPLVRFCLMHRDTADLVVGPVGFCRLSDGMTARMSQST
jgi:hypothetical protein